MRKELLLILLTVFMFISCSQDNESIMNQVDNTETRATDSNPLIITTPTEMYFSLTEGQTQTINVKIGGLPSLGVLTSITATVQGPDALYFQVDMPQLSLSDMLGLLLGNGLDIEVTYFPPTEESRTHEAELLIETSLLGIIAPMQTIVPLHGETSTRAPFIITTPTEMNFSITEGNATSQTQSFILQLGGASGVVRLLDSLAVNIVGPEGVFSGNLPQASLEELDRRLREIGLEVEAAYRPLIGEPGTHEGELLIEVYLVGVPDPLQAILPLRGEYLASAIE